MKNKLKWYAMCHSHACPRCVAYGHMTDVLVLFVQEPLLHAFILDWSLPRSIREVYDRSPKPCLYSTFWVSQTLRWGFSPQKKICFVKIG